MKIIGSLQITREITSFLQYKIVKKLFNRNSYGHLIKWNCKRR